jgi:hypothetical protein
VTGNPPARPARARTSRHDRGQLAGLTEALGESAELLLIGASVYREPADRNALLFQVGQHDWTAARAPDRQSPAPPYEEPPDLGDMIAACEAAGLLTVGFVAPRGSADRARPARHAAARSDAPTVFVDRWTASELHRVLEAVNRGHDLAQAHLRAVRALGGWLPPRSASPVPRHRHPRDQDRRGARRSYSSDSPARAHSGCSRQAPQHRSVPAGAGGAGETCVVPVPGRPASGRVSSRKEVPIGTL